MFSEKLKKQLKVLYLVFVVLFFFFVKHSLSQDSLLVVESKEKLNNEPTFESRIVRINVEVLSNGENLAQTQKFYEIEIENHNTVLDALEQLRDSQGLYFEKDVYKNKTVLYNFNNIILPANYVWQVVVVEDQEDYRESVITNTVGDILVEHRYLYKIYPVLVK